MRRRDFYLICPSVLVLSIFATVTNTNDASNDILYLRKLLTLKKSDSRYATSTPGTLTSSITSTDLSTAIALTTESSLADEFYNSIFIGNGSDKSSLRTAIKEAMPNLQTLRMNNTDRLTRQRALVELAVQMQPFIAPFAANHPNLTAKVSALGEAMSINRTARAGGGGYGGGGGGGGGWGWGGWGGSGWQGGGHCCWGGGGGGGGGGGWGTAVLVKGWGGDDDQLLKYLALKGGKGSGSDELSTLLPLLFGLIALLIMKLPT